MGKQKLFPLLVKKRSMRYSGLGLHTTVQQHTALDKNRLHPLPMICCFDFFFFFTFVAYFIGVFRDILFILSTYGSALHRWTKENIIVI